MVEKKSWLVFVIISIFVVFFSFYASSQVYLILIPLLFGTAIVFSIYNHMPKKQSAEDDKIDNIILMLRMGNGAKYKEEIRKLKILKKTGSEKEKQKVCGLYNSLEKQR